MDTSGIKDFAPTGWAQALQGFSAGVAGRLPEFQQQRAQLSESRREALVKDARKTMIHLKNGDVDSATGLLRNRVEAIGKLGGDPSDTMGVLQLLEAGDIETALRELQTVDEAAVANGMLEPMQKHVGVAGSYGVTMGPDGNYRTQSLPGVAEEIAEEADRQSRHTSAKTEFLPDGSALFADNQGRVTLVDPRGREITDPAERSRIIQEAQDFKIRQRQEGARAEATAGQSVTMAKDFFDRIQPLQESIQLVEGAVAEIDNGANTGPAMALLPSIRNASIALDNLQARMGLNVIQSTTFGALSESELKFALDTALPTKMKPPELKQWLLKKRDAQEKLITYLRRAGMHFSSGGDLNSWLQQEQSAARTRPQTPGQATPPAEEQDMIELYDGSKVPRAALDAIRRQITITPVEGS